MKGKSWFLIAIVLMTSAALAQLAPEPPMPAAAPEPQRGFMPGPGRDGMRMPGGDGMRMRDGGIPGGKWWKDSQTVQALGISDQQAQQMEKIFQDHRMQLVDLHANLEKAELAMEPMMQADQPNESQVNAQIDKIAQARAALEKSNAQMLFAIRRVLTPDQWKKLQTQHHEPRGFGRGMEAPRPAGPDGGPMRFNRRERAPRPAQPGAPAAAPAPAPSSPPVE